jgi:predicted ATPase
MIKTWTLEQFKSVHNKTSLEMAPLTIFTGANNSGKSTIIQSMLLTAQTIQNPVHNRSVVLNGHIIKLGTFEDIASNKEETKDITLGFELVPSSTNTRLTRRHFISSQTNNISEETTVGCNYTFTCEGFDDLEITNLNPQLKNCHITISNSYIEEEILINRRESASSVHNLGVSEKYIAPFQDALVYDVVKIPQYNERRYLRRSPNKGKPVGASLQHFLPNRITHVYDLLEEEVSNLINVCTHPEHYNRNYYNLKEYVTDKIHKSIIDCFQQVYFSLENNFSKRRREKFKKYFHQFSLEFTFENLLASYAALTIEGQNKYTDSMEEKSSKLKELAKLNRSVEHALFNADIPESIAFSTDFIFEFFTKNVKYLGPLRDEPKPVYPYTGTTDSSDVGYKGEHTAAVLEIHKNTQISYISPYGFNVETSPEIKSGSLMTAVLEWLDYMGVVSNVKTVDRGKLGHELKVSTHGEDKWHDLTHVGVGVSQVLPILVLSLLANTGSTLIFEQPELHLHPRVQTRLADFFVSMSTLEKQCIVETHSEYLINRLRYHSVISEDSTFSDKIIMYFVEKVQGKSNYRPIKINKYGVIEDWPKGFFDENEENSASILRAAMNKRKRESQNKYD